MSASSSSETTATRPARRRLLLALLACGALAACGKKGTLRLPRPDELDDEDDGEIVE